MGRIRTMKRREYYIKVYSENGIIDWIYLGYIKTDGVHHHIFRVGNDLLMAKISGKL